MFYKKKKKKAIIFNDHLVKFLHPIVEKIITYDLDFLDRISNVL